ncbi:hypothetical protein SAMN05216247_11458 [Pseudomonas salomonii]|uniref:Uncharacterized protein n=1 Tax=Pseudomonas salomonii TaxID=191391 RepID=A0A1H3UH87_9PSED|nr:hypothetical protein SAMN05216247_11458 [Pseudomonas salomonii]
MPEYKDFVPKDWHSLELIHVYRASGRDVPSRAVAHARRPLFCLHVAKPVSEAGAPLYCRAVRSRATCPAARLGSNELFVRSLRSEPVRSSLCLRIGECLTDLRKLCTLAAYALETHSRYPYETQSDNRQRITRRIGDRIDFRYRRSHCTCTQPCRLCGGASFAKFCRDGTRHGCRNEADCLRAS